MIKEGRRKVYRGVNNSAREKLEIMFRVEEEREKYKKLPLILSLPRTEPTPRSSLTKKLSVDPPPSSRHLNIIPILSRGNRINR